jgi:hypothetical protein
LLLDEGVGGGGGKGVEACGSQTISWLLSLHGAADDIFRSERIQILFDRYFCRSQQARLKKKTFPISVSLVFVSHGGNNKARESILRIVTHILIYKLTISYTTAALQYTTT